MEKLLGEKQPRKAASLFGKYRLLRSLKRSPFLENYFAQEESPPHALVVLKRLHPLVVHRTDWVSLFLDEVKQAATLWHPNIIRIYDLGEIDGIPYFVQPYFFGKKLQTLLARSRSLPIPTGMALLLVRQLLEALHFAHGLRGPSGRPIAHGGLHPERIFIGYDGVVGLSDFGLGWLEDPRSAIRSRYRAPESILERKGGESSAWTPGEDLFAASAILCELLGEFPEPVKPGTEPWGYFPASIRSILVGGLAIEPIARFQAAAEMMAPIEAILQSEYPRLNLTNYIQAFFGKEIEAERRAFARFVPSGGEGSAPGETPLFERLEPPADLAPPVPEPARSFPELPQEPAGSEFPAVVVMKETRASLPVPSDLPAAEAVGVPSEATLEKKISSWQPIWWGLFGLLMSGFVGVLFFSLYRSSSSKIALMPTPPPAPMIEARRDPIDPPPPLVEESVTQEGEREGAGFPEPPPPAQAPVSSAVEAIKEPASPSGKLGRDQINRPAVLPTPQNNFPSVPVEAPPETVAPPEASLAAAKKIPPKLREELPPQPKVEEMPLRPKTNEEMLRELIERQRRAYQSQDWTLSRQDVADERELQGQIAELFGGAQPIRVEFEVFALKVRGEEADISLMQTARLRNGKNFSLQKSLLFWKLKKEKDRWKIEKFNVIEKYPPIEVG